MGRRLSVCVASALFCVGLLILLYPYINGAMLEHRSSSAAESFISAHSEITAPPEATARPNSELYNAMQEYSQRIYEENQSGLSDPSAYESAAIDLSAYGVEDGIVAVLTIPALELEMPVYLGASYENMAAGAAVLGQTSLPIGGSSTNCVIAGHRGWNGAAYFRYIDLLQPGDEVLVTNLWETLSYTVSEIQVIDPNDVKKVFIQDGRELLTLLTCHPYASGGQYRYLVICERSAP